ncbi:hypothetical protein [Sporolactobacillus terrae]|uniref:hypothetical protein n=1 Tax=Sporolactobacillus terrae TaxID=269673 RepID=UPI00049009D1|nr:hypothetical protein [Sporolactobacillus terrae]
MTVFDLEHFLEDRLTYHGPTIWEMIFTHVGGFAGLSIVGTLAIMAYIKPTRLYIIAGVVAFIFI